MRTLACRAALLVRDTRFGDVNRLAGNSGENVTYREGKGGDDARSGRGRAIVEAAACDCRGLGQRTKRPVKVKLDEAYFRGYVEPILEKRGKDGYACVHCHATHTLFNGTYATALNVVDPSQPENSLILLKPTSSSESEGVAGANSLAHGGGVRWAKDSPEYVTILEWIKGAKE